MASRTFALSCIWLLFLLAQESPYAFGQNATFADNSSKPSMNQTDLSEFVNVTIPVQLLPNETLAALNLTGNSSIVNASILLNPNDPDTGDLKFYLGTLNSTNSTNNVSKHCSNVEPDYVVLAIQWPVFLCSHSLCAKDAKQNWTVHGLWPSSLRPDKKSHPEYCCNNHTFNETQLQSIRPQLAVSVFLILIYSFVFRCSLLNIHFKSF